MSDGAVTRPATSSLVREGAAAFLIYGLLAAALTWPVARAPSRLGVPNPDFYGNTWVLAWVVRQVLRDPLHLFDSNIYWPLPQSLVYNESLIPQALLAAPVLLLGGSPLLGHNFAFGLTFALGGLSGFVLSRELGASRGGAFLAGLAFGFCPVRFKWINNIQCGSLQWLPLALVCFVRSLRAGGKAALGGLYAFAVLQALSSGYFALLLPPSFAVALLWLWREKPLPRRLARAGLVLALAGLTTLAVYWPYVQVQERDHLHRSEREWVHWSARPQSYLDPGRFVQLPHQVWMRERFAGFEPLYPGAVVLLLGLAGAATCARIRPARLYAGLFLTGLLLSFGPKITWGPLELPGPFELLRLLPATEMLRTPSRFGLLAVLGLCLLAGAFWTDLVARRPALGRALPALVLLLLVELYPAGLAYAFRRLEPPPPSSAWLATAPPGPILELPWTDFDGGALYVYWSTAHWRPLVNGWGSFQPRGAGFGLGRLGQRWPSGYVSRAFRTAGVRYVVLHLDRLAPEARARVLGLSELPPGVSLRAELGSARIYEIDPSGERLREGAEKKGLSEAETLPVIDESSRRKSPATSYSPTRLP